MSDILQMYYSYFTHCKWIIGQNHIYIVHVMRGASANQWLTFVATNNWLSLRRLSRKVSRGEYIYIYITVRDRFTKKGTQVCSRKNLLSHINNKCYNRRTLSYLPFTWSFERKRNDLLIIPNHRKWGLNVINVDATIVSSLPQLLLWVSTTWWLCIRAM